MDTWMNDNYMVKVMSESPFLPRIPDIDWPGIEP
jgi:hypothetical protein